MATDAPRGPTDLYFVGPATATVLDGAPFEASDVADRRVSHHELLEAGVAPDVADELRREYSLVWSFEWRVGGSDLPHRAEAIRGLGPEERAWIAESASGDAAGEAFDGERWESREGIVESDETRESHDESGERDEEGGEPPEGERDSSPLLPEEDACPRCDGRLETFVLGSSGTVSCADCGYAGIEPR